jgi:hypothetical protein
MGTDAIAEDEILVKSQAKEPKIMYKINLRLTGLSDFRAKQ